MTRRSINMLIPAVCAVLIVFGTTGTRAEPLVEVDPSQRDAWSAVGHLQGPGYRMSRGCSATLIAADLVVTAAHCLTGALWDNENQQFRAGLDGETYVARSTYREVAIHPLFSSRKGKARLPYDLAVVHLTEPISPDRVTPLPLQPRAAMPATFATLLGYRHDAPGVLAGRQGCPALFAPDSAVQRYGCEVVSGISGGAVIVDTAQGPVLAAIIVARHGEDGDALAIPVNSWLREKLRQSPHYKPASR